MFIVIVFLISALLAYAIETSREYSVRNALILVCLLFLTFVSGTRLVGGTDYASYEALYQRYPDFWQTLKIKSTDMNFEKGYLVCSSFFSSIGVSFYGFCMVCAAFFYFSLWKSMSRYTKHFGIVILVFLYKLFFYDTFVSLRQSITIAGFLLIIPLIENKKWIRYFFWCYVLSRFHNGAYILFPLYFLTYFKLTKKRILLLNLIFLPTITFGVLGIDVFGPIGHFLASNATTDQELQKVNVYFGDNILSPIGIFHTLEYYLLMILFYNNVSCLDLNNSKVRISILMFLCLLPLFTLLRGSEILTREKDYFIIFYAVIVGYLIDMKYNRTLIYLVVFLLCAFGYFRFALLFDNGDMFNYSSWLFNSNYHFFK